MYGDNIERAIPERIDVEAWRLRFWAVLGSEYRAARVLDLAFAEYERSALTLSECLDVFYLAAIEGWLSPAPGTTLGGSRYRSGRTFAGGQRSLSRALRALTAEIAAALRLRRWRKHPPGWYVLQ